MRSKARMILAMAAVGLLLTGLATESLARSRRPTTQDPVLRGNPLRDAGGSCVYDKQGKVVFEPQGKRCPDGTDYLTNPRRASSPVVASYPPGIRHELSRLLRDHDRIAQEIARLRWAVESQNQGVALEALGKIRAQITDHRAREERFAEEMTRTQTR